MLRVLYVANGGGLSPDPSGSIIRTAHVAQELAKRGHHIAILTTPGGRTACLRAGFDGEYHVVPAALFRRVERNVYDRAWSYVVSTAASIARIPFLPPFDVLCTDSEYPCDIVPAAAYRALRHVPWVASVHHLLEAETTLRASLAAAFKQKAQHVCHSFIAWFAERILLLDSASGRNVARRFAELGVPDARVTYVPNGVDMELLARTPPSPTGYDACIVGGLRPAKGLYSIVPIWAQVLERRPGARLAVIGAAFPAYREEFESAIHRAGLGGTIDILGVVDRATLFGLIKSSKVAIAPSLEEGWGMAVAESLAAGTPVVAFDLPAYRSVFAGGIVYASPRDHRSFGDRVADLLDSDAERAALAAEGQGATARFGWPLVAMHDEALLRELAAH